MDWYRTIGESLGYVPAEENTYSPLTLAYIGDAIYELLIRSYVAGQGNGSPNRLNRMSTTFVNAHGQCELFDRIKPFLTKEEQDWFRRGRNAKSGSMAKHATMWEYRRATGFEAMAGYLYVTGQMERLLELIKKGLERWEDADGGEKQDESGERPAQGNE